MPLVWVFLLVRIRRTDEVFAKVTVTVRCLRSQASTAWISRDAHCPAQAWPPTIGG